MAQYKSEYSNKAVCSDGCSYSRLGCYLGSNPAKAPLKPNTTSGVYVTPDYSAPGYDALTHGVGSSCKSHFSIQNAYGNCSTSYTSRLCDSGCGGGSLGGSAWRCAPNMPGGGKCMQVQAGTPGGPTYKTESECKQAGCPKRY